MYIRCFNSKKKDVSFIITELCPSICMTERSEHNFSRIRPHMRIHKSEQKTCTRNRVRNKNDAAAFIRGYSLCRGPLPSSHSFVASSRAFVTRIFARGTNYVRHRLGPCASTLESARNRPTMNLRVCTLRS